MARWLLILLLAALLLAAPTWPLTVTVVVTDAPRGMSGNQCRQVGNYEFICHGEPPYRLEINQLRAPGPYWMPPPLDWENG